MLTGKLRGKEIADLFGVTRPTVELWVKKHGAPKGLDGYDLSKVLPWYVAWRDRREREARRGGEDVQALNLRNLRAKTELLEVEAARANREVVNVTDAGRILDEFIISLKSRILSMPRRAGALLPGSHEMKRRAEACFDVFVKEVLEELSTFPDSLARLAGEKERGQVKEGGGDLEGVSQSESSEV